MNIGGFNIGKKTVIIVGAVVVAIAVSSIASSNAKKKELEDRIEAERIRREQALSSEAETTVALTFDEQQQKALIEEYGEPPEGFRWDFAGNLVAISSDDITPEDLLYTYVRSLSMLDFATAQRYSSQSFVVSTYSKRYSAISASITDYYNDFLRKQYKYALTTLEVLGLGDVAVFADGTEYITMKIMSLDLEDKDFWQEDKETLFETMRIYDDTEDDDIKKQRYVYDYIYNAYESGLVGKKEYTIEFVLSKESGAGWLVSDDSELNSILDYTNGVDVASYIFREYSDWIRGKQLEEMRIGLSN